MKKLVTFITCGYVNLAKTASVVRAMDEAGVDVVELGIPFSDPTAEGETIQMASLEALKNGVNTDEIFEMVAGLDVRARLVFMSYANVVFGYGVEKFARRCSEVGVKSVILPDVPFEEKGEFEEAFGRFGVSLVSFVAPTSKERVEKIARAAKGEFIYLVSSLGVTGVRDSFSSELGSLAREIKRFSNLPVCVGFGVGSAQSAKEMCQICDGVIIGSKIIELMRENPGDEERAVGEFLREVRAEN